MTNKQRIPNLFLIGAPKSGTTAMSRYLAGHPDIFMSEQVGIKEPFYFASDLSQRERPITEQVDYFTLFKDAPARAIYLGEASTGYLYSQVAVSDILTMSPNAKFVVMLRNPIDVAQRFHNQLVKVSKEPIVEFEAAWRAQNQRSKGDNIPQSHTDYRLFMYGERSCLGVQLERLFMTAPRRQVHVIVYDDFSANTKQSFIELLQFLDLNYYGNCLFSVENPSVTFRYPAIQRWLIYAKDIRKQLGIPGGIGIHKLINKFNVHEGLLEINAPFRNELREYFRPEVELISSLLNRDFSHWLS